MMKNIALTVLYVFASIFTIEMRANGNFRKDSSIFLCDFILAIFITLSLWSASKFYVNDDSEKDDK